MTTETKKLDLKKLLIPIGAVIALIAVILTIVLVVTGKESYRLIKINSFQGGIELQREEKGSVEVFEGLQLISADTVAVGEGAFLELLADSDKHIAAEENTGFKLYSSGDEKSGNISIDLLYGKALFTIDNKLNEGSFFQVTSPNATLSVRGTTFSTEYNAEEETTIAEVMEGTVVVTCNGGAKTLEKGDKVAVIGSGDNVRIEELTDSEYLLTLAKTYPQIEKYTEGKAEHFITVSEYTATAAGIMDMVYSDSEKQGSPLLNPQSMLKGYLDSHAEEVNKYFEENKATAVKSGKAEDKDVTEWIDGNITVGGATFIVDKAYLNISVKGKSSDAYYFTSETHKVRENGRDMYYYADGVTLTVYGSTEEKPAVTTTTTAATTTTTAVTTTTTSAPEVVEETIGFQIWYHKYEVGSQTGYTGYVYNNNYPEGYSFKSSPNSKMAENFSEIVNVIKNHKTESEKYFTENYEESIEYCASLIPFEDYEDNTEVISDWFAGKIFTVADDNGKTLKLRVDSCSMSVNGGSANADNADLMKIPSEYKRTIGDYVYFSDRIIYAFGATVIEDNEPTVTTPVVTEAPVTTTKATTTAPVTTTKKTTVTTKAKKDLNRIKIVDTYYDSESKANKEFSFYFNVPPGYKLDEYYEEMYLNGEKLKKAVLVPKKENTSEDCELYISASYGSSDSSKRKLMEEGEAFIGRYGHYTVVDEYTCSLGKSKTADVYIAEVDDSWEPQESKSYRIFAHVDADRYVNIYSRGSGNPEQLGKEIFDIAGMDVEEFARAILPPA